jgi:cell wall assembly regulator SMI1
MQEIWTYIESWLYANAPKVLDTLQPGASDTQIKAAEHFLSIQFPAEVKDSYRIHNGQSSYGYGFLEGNEFLSLERMQEEWQVWKELLDGGEFEDFESYPDTGICSDWWSAQWIPLTYDGAGNHDCLDLNPSEGGKHGQIITMWHDEPGRQIIAPSFRAWLEEYAEDLKSGQFVFSEENKGIFNVDYI